MRRWNPQGHRTSPHVSVPRFGQTVWRIVQAISYLCLALVCWLVTVRGTSPWNAVRVYQTPSETKPSLVLEDYELRIGVYNIAHGRGTAVSNWQGGNLQTRLGRLEAIAQLLVRENLDVVVLNEVDFDCNWSGRVNQAEQIAKLAGFPHRVEQRNLDVAIPGVSFRFGNAVLSKHPILRAQLVRLPGDSRWKTLVAGKKDSVVCRLQLPDGRRVRIMPIHFSPRSEKLRVASAHKVLEQAAHSSVPLVAAGDFNSAPPGFPKAQPDKFGKTAISILVDEGDFLTLPQDKPRPEEMTFSTVEPHRVIDWIMTSPPGRLVEHRVPHFHYSDHYPVIGTVRFD